MKQATPAFRQGFIQAFGVTLYCSLVGVLFWKGNDIFPHLNNYSGPVLMLLIFSTSVLICGLMVFYKPYKMFFADKKKKAVSTVIFTAFWQFLILLIFVLGMFIFR